MFQDKVKRLSSSQVIPSNTCFCEFLFLVSMILIRNWFFALILLSFHILTSSEYSSPVNLSDIIQHIEKWNLATAT